MGSLPKYEQANFDYTQPTKLGTKLYSKTYILAKGAANLGNPPSSPKVSKKEEK